MMVGVSFCRPSGAQNIFFCKKQQEAKSASCKKKFTNQPQKIFFGDRFFGCVTHGFSSKNQISSFIFRVFSFFWVCDPSLKRKERVKRKNKKRHKRLRRRERGPGYIVHTSDTTVHVHYYYCTLYVLY
jgi:hypothetical protein